MATKTHDEIYEQAVVDFLQNRLIFTDGSGLAGYIGAGTADQLHGAVDKTRRRYLGTEEQSTVYAGELHGIEMALATARYDNKDKIRELTIFSDSQAAILAVQDPRRPSGQYVLSLLYDHVKAIRSLPDQDQFKITIRWIPAHTGIWGNEWVDIEAKSAALIGAGADPTATATKPTIRLAAAAKRAVRQRIGAKWTQQWDRERTSTPTKRLVQAPSRKILRLYDGLSKPQCAILIQMRTMRIGLKHFLYKIKATDSDRCGCDAGSQTPKHVLLECSEYIGLRMGLWEKIQRIEGMETETDYDKIMSHP